MNNLKMSLQSRLALATFLSIAAFFLIAVVVFAALNQVRSDISEVIDIHFQNTVNNSKQTRELGQVLARIALLEVSFYGNDEYIEQESKFLLSSLNQHDHLHDNPKLLALHEPLFNNLIKYLDLCKEINDLLRRLSWQEEDLSDSFIIFEESIAELKNASYLIKEDSRSLEQVSVMLGRYRVELLEFLQQKRLETPQDYFQSDFSDLPENAEIISALIFKLKSFNPPGKDLLRLSRHLTGQLRYYLHLIERFQQDMVYLGQLSDALNQVTDQVFSEMAISEQQYSSAATKTATELDTTIRTTSITVLALLSILVLLLGLIQLNLYTHHIKRPMAKIRNRLMKFHDGDYSSPMVLERDDEWGQIEAVFNDMLRDLRDSWDAVQESERRYRNIFDSASVGIYQSTVDGAFININPALAIMLEIDAYAELSEYTDLATMIYANPDDRNNLIKRLIAEETVSHYEVQMRRKSGEIFWASVNGHLVRDKDEKIQFVEGTIDDISYRRQAQNELQRLKEYLQDIVDTMPSILVGLDEHLKITIWNWQVADLTGIKESLAQGQRLEDVFHLIDISEYLETIEETMSSYSVVRLQKIRGINAGAGRIFDLLIYPLSSTDKPGVVIHMDDVTEKNQIEEVMVQSEKMLTVGNLAAGMAHEINNPLASVLQNVQVMEQRLSPALKKNQEVAEQLGVSVEKINEYIQLRGFDKMIKSIADAGQRAARIIENMLNFSRKSSSSFVSCSLVDLLEKTIELAGSDYEMKHDFDFRSIKVKRDYQSVPDVPCESSQIQQVILSLLKNATQAIGKQPEPEISVRVFEEDENVCVEIADNGGGMDEATCRRIFEPFYTTKEVGQGTGLGLSVAYFLIRENHKGSLTATSKEGQGSSFRIALPIHRSVG